MKKFIEVSFKILEWICIICMVAFVALIFVQVITRTLNISVPWTDELARFVLVWTTFVGSAVVTRKRLQLGVDYFVNKMPKTPQKIVNFAMCACAIFFQGVLLIYGTKLSILSINTLSPTLQWSTGLIYLVLPITAALTIVLLLQQTFFIKKGQEE